MSRRILIVGGFGFVGVNLLRAWSREHPGDRIMVVDSMKQFDARSVVGTDPKLLHSPIDITDYQMVRRVMEVFRPDHLINAATAFHHEQTPLMHADFYLTNVLGTWNLLDAFQKLWGDKVGGHRFVQLSTSEIFGSLKDEDEPFTESSACRPLSAYASSKLCGDDMVLHAHHAYGMDTVVINASDAYGPHQKPQFLIPLVIRACVERKGLTIPGGQAIRDWIHVDDLCWGIMQCFELGRAGARYCLGGDAERSVSEVVTMASSICDRIHQTRADYPRQGDQPFLITSYDSGHTPRRAVSNDLVRREFGWEPDLPFEVGLESTVEWYLNRWNREVA